MRICTNFGVKPQKKIGLHYKICEKTVLAHEFWGDYQYLGSLKPRNALQWHRACYFLWGTILAWGAQFSFGGASSELGKHGPVMPPGAPGLVRPNLRLTGKINECLAKTFFFVFDLKLPGKV